MTTESLTSCTDCSADLLLLMCIEQHDFYLWLGSLWGLFFSITLATTFDQVPLVYILLTSPQFCDRETTQSVTLYKVMLDFY